MILGPIETYWLVRHAELQPCRTAFIDARTPGSHLKENFTIIGPGVAENPDQHVHVRRPHGFNIGGARQPPRCVNSQHFHETAEVFFVHSGRWAFRTGQEADEGEVTLEPGDTISIPIHIFRGFENIGTETGFLYAVLGGDDPGKVTWAPDVLRRAKEHGLILAESGRLIDTLKGETLATDERAVSPLSADALATIVAHADAQALERCVARSHAAFGFVTALARDGVIERAVIGSESPLEGAPTAALAWPHGFSCRIMTLDPDAAVDSHLRGEEEVWFLHRGQLDFDIGGTAVRLGAGDVLSIAPGESRSFANPGRLVAQAFVTRRGDRPAPPLFARAHRPPSAAG